MQFPVDGVIVGHGEVLSGIFRTECPKINDLAAMGVGYLDDLVLFEKESGTAAGREGLWSGHDLKFIERRMGRRSRKSLYMQRSWGRCIDSII